MHKYLILILLLYSCDNVTAPQIKEDTGGSTQYEYLINFEGLNTGNYFDLCTLRWNQYPNDDFDSYSLRSGEELIIIEQRQDTTFIKELTPEAFEKIYIDVESGTVATDSMEIYTRPIKPITNLSTAANADNWFSTLTWSSSDEISAEFEKYSIYRSDINADNFMLIKEIYAQNDSSYIDTITTWGYEYYYKIDTHTIEGYSRHSIIQSNITNNITNYEISLNATNNQYNRINLSWNHDLNEQEFYAIEIWRTDIQLSDPLDDYLLATITDYNKNLLEDSYQVGNGISWFYKLKLIDQFGNESYSSIVAGNSLP
tara:strand:+ start:178 stop:1119 length:942 start_codon:yes stop_codon:yes gene_type:complete